LNAGLKGRTKPYEGNLDSRDEIELAPDVSLLAASWKRPGESVPQKKLKT